MAEWSSFYKRSCQEKRVPPFAQVARFMFSLTRSPSVELYRCNVQFIRIPKRNELIWLSKAYSTFYSRLKSLLFYPSLRGGIT